LFEKTAFTLKKRQDVAVLGHFLAALPLATLPFRANISF
jgi:hypothetical protein